MGQPLSWGAAMADGLRSVWANTQAARRNVLRQATQRQPVDRLTYLRQELALVPYIRIGNRPSHGAR